jgi:hypothetical protein
MFRFRRRITLFPGLSINLGKRGASLSVGVRGAHVTFGTKGVRTSVGVPGTGMGWTSYQRYGQSSPQQSSPEVYETVGDHKVLTHVNEAGLKVATMTLDQVLDPYKGVTAGIEATVAEQLNDAARKAADRAFSPLSEDHRNELIGCRFMAQQITKGVEDLLRDAAISHGGYADVAGSEIERDTNRRFLELCDIDDKVEAIADSYIDPEIKAVMDEAMRKAREAREAEEPQQPSAEPAPQINEGVGLGYTGQSSARERRPFPKSLIVIAVIGGLWLVGSLLSNHPPALPPTTPAPIVKAEPAPAKPTSTYVDVPQEQARRTAIRASRPNQPKEIPLR